MDELGWACEGAAVLSELCLKVAPETKDPEVWRVGGAGRLKQPMDNNFRPGLIKTPLAAFCRVFLWLFLFV